MVYYVLPTEPLDSCVGNVSCPSGHDQLCHSMDYLAKHSSEFFSRGHTNITLVFLCGIHNCTKDWTVQDLHSLVIQGAAGPEQTVLDCQHRAQLNKPSCSIIQLTNTSFVSDMNLTMRCPSVNLNDSFMAVKDSNLYGYASTNKSLSFINITGKGSRALLDNCTHKENIFFCEYFQ